MSKDATPDNPDNAPETVAPPGGKPVSRNEIIRLCNATRYSLAGLQSAWREEPSVRLLILEFAVFVPLALYLGKGMPEKILLALPCFISLAIELLNSAIENVVDDISLERRPRAKKAKDMGSAAQFVGLLFFALVWITFIVTKLIG